MSENSDVFWTSDMENEAVFSALAHPVRRQVISLLLREKRTAGAIAEEFEISRSAVSEHLGVLRQANLVRETKSGRERIYSLNAAPLADLRGWLEPFEAYWKAKLGRLAKQLEDENE
jgi:DNA-binding transcriptional ArsR family regulator